MMGWYFVHVQCRNFIFLIANHLSTHLGSGEASNLGYLSIKIPRKKMF